MGVSGNKERVCNVTRGPPKLVNQLDNRPFQELYSTAARMVQVNAFHPFVGYSLQAMSIC